MRLIIRIKANLSSTGTELGKNGMENDGKNSSQQLSLPVNR